MKPFKVRFWQLDHKQFTYFDLSKLEDVKRLADLMEYEVLEKQLSTSLKDKNGKEIYESDLMNLKDKENKNIGTVWFDESVSGFRLKTHNSSFYLQEADEVVGNIYEDEDLLK